MKDFLEDISFEDFDDLSNIVTLTDPDGNDVDFEFVDLIAYEDEEYVVLLPAGDENESEVVILKLEDEDEDDDEVSFLPVESEEALSAIYEMFKEKFKDEYDFVD